jgi:hypothetical protein
MTYRLSSDSTHRSPMALLKAYLHAVVRQSLQYFQPSCRQKRIAQGKLRVRSGRATAYNMRFLSGSRSSKGTFSMPVKVSRATRHTTHATLLQSEPEAICMAEAGGCGKSATPVTSMDVMLEAGEHATITRHKSRVTRAHLSLTLVRVSSS